MSFVVILKNVEYTEFYKIITDIKNVRIFTLKDESAPALSKQIVFFHYVKALSLLDTIQILCQRNKTGESGIILRSLLNLFINLKWLTLKEDSDKRMQRYADYEIISKKRKMDLASIRPSNPSENQKAEKLNKNFDEIVKKYNLNPKNWKDLSLWSGKTIRQMAKDVSLLDDYEKIYSYLSFEEHTDPSTARNYLSRSKNEISSFIAKPDDYFIALMLWTAIARFFSDSDLKQKG